MTTKALTISEMRDIMNNAPDEVFEEALRDDLITEDVIPYLDIPDDDLIGDGDAY